MADATQIDLDASGVPSSAATLNPAPGSAIPRVVTPPVLAPQPVPTTSADTTPQSVPATPEALAPQPAPESASVPTFDLSKQSNDDILNAPISHSSQAVDLSKQSNDDILGGEPSAWSTFKTAVPYFLGGGGVGGNVARDQFFRGTTAGRVLDAFGQGFSQGWGSEPVGMSDDTRKWLRDARIITNDDDSPWARPFKAFNESFLRVGAAAWDLGMRVPAATIGGGAAGAGQSLQEMGASETTGNELERTLNLLPFALGDVAMNTPHPPEAIPRRAAAAEVSTEAPAPVRAVAEAPTPVEQAGMKTDLAAQAELPALPDTQVSPQLQPQAKTPAAPPTVDELAAQHNPAVMDQWQSLMKRRDSYRQWIDDLNTQREAAANANSPYADQIAQTQGQISDLQARMGDATPRLAKKYSARIDDLQTQAADLQRQHEDYVADAMSRDSPDVARVRAALMQNDYRMRDLAVPVSDAYRAAREQVAAREEALQKGEPPPPEAATPEPVTTPNEAVVKSETPSPEAVAGATEEAPGSGGIPASMAEEVAPAIKAEAPEPAATREEHFNAISDDVSQKLQAAGRSKEEAETLAPIIAAHYDARASRFDDRTALDMYQKEGPEITTGRATTKRGTAKLVEGQRPVIRLMQSADASTFMHESGHVWLHELMQDAGTEGVHPSVIADAGAVREWLGNTGGAITRGQHEKFARGLEDYLYTGRAPSPRLANVFEQARDWLVSVYQATRRSAVDIPDNIRDIFDRLIERNPERQPAAGERPVTKELADLHEVDAEHTPPASAAGIGHNIEEDMQRAADERPPFGEDIHEGTGRRPGESLEDTAALDRPRLETGNDGLPRESGTAPSVEERQRAGPGETEGVGSREEPGGNGIERDEGQTVTVSKRAVQTEPPANANDGFGPSPKPERLFDKAGNIRLENLNRPEDIKDVLRNVALENDGFIHERGGVIPLVDQQAAADALGFTPENFVPNRPPDITESQWLRAVKDLTLRSATNVRDLMIQTKNSRSDADAAALAKALSLHQMIQGEFSRAKAESGRALAANRWDDAKALVEGIATTAERATGMTLDQLKRLAADGSPLDTPAKISKFVEDSFKPTLRDKVQYVALNGLISGPVTHMTYLAANMLNAIFKITVENPISATLGNIRELTGTAKDGRIYWSEIPAGAYGMFRGGRDGVRAAIQAWREGMTTPLPGEDVNGFYMSHYRPMPIKGPIGVAIGVPGRVIGSLDAFSRNVFYSMNIAEQAARAAISEGLVGEARARRVAELTRDPSAEMMESARDFATSLAYMKKPKYGSAMYHIERFANSSLPTKMMLPFVRTGANIIDMGYVQRTPVGVLSESMRNDLLGRNGNIAADTARAKMIAGVAIGAALTGLVLEGRATGAAPKDPQKRALFLAMHPEYSIKIGGSWVAYKRLGHLGLIMGMGANLAQTIESYDQDGADAAVAQMAHGIASGVVDESWMAGLKNVLDLVDNPEGRGSSIMFSFASEGIPFSSLLRQSANVLDPYMRQPHGWGERLENMIPGWRNDLMPRRDIWGEPIGSRQSPVYSLAAAPFQNQYPDDPVNTELERLGVAPAAPEKKYKGVELTPQQYDDYSRVMGRLKRQMTVSLVNSPGWNTMPDEVKVQALRSAWAGMSKSATGALLMQYPAIIQQVQEKKLSGGR
jgi:hypothetical protein